MGCGASKNGGGNGEAANGKESGDAGRPAPGARKQSIFKTIPEIKVETGEAVKLLPALPRVIFIFGIYMYTVIFFCTP